MSDTTTPQPEAKSSVLAKYNNKQEPAVEVKVYEGADRAELDRIGDLAVQVAQRLYRAM